MSNKENEFDHQHISHVSDGIHVTPYIWCLLFMLETSSIYIMRSHSTEACLTSSTSCFKIQTNSMPLENWNGRIFLPGFSLSLQRRLYKKNMGEWETKAWINLIWCALLSNSSYTWRIKTETEKEASSIMHEGVWAINSVQNHTRKLANWIHFQFSDSDII
jgi:hypothetical protein